MASARPQLSRRGARSRMLPYRELRRAPFIYLGRALLSRGTLFPEQPPLALETPSVSTESATPPYDTVTGDDDGGSIVRARACHRPHRFRSSDRLRDFAV